MVAVRSRRFGVSLGVDLSPNEKVCNYDCLYCELKGAKTKTAQTNPLGIQEIVCAVNAALEKYPHVDFLTITANGEPTLYPYLDELVNELIKIKGDKKLLILSNGSGVANPQVAKTLLKFDAVKLSLDCVTQKCFKKLDRPNKAIDLEKIIQGMIDFSHEFKNDLFIEILVVKNINDHEDEIKAINEILKKMRFTRVDLGTIDRPPAYKVEGVSFEKLRDLSKLIDTKNIYISHRTKNTGTKYSLNKDEILSTIKLRSFCEDDFETIYDKNTLENLQSLISDGKIGVKKIGEIVFFIDNNQ